MKPNGTKKYVLKFNGMRGGVENEDLSFSKLSMGVSHVNGSLKSDVGMGRGKRQISVADSEEDLPILTLNSDDVYIKDLFLYRRTLSDGTYDDRLIAHTTNNLLYSLALYDNGDWTAIDGVTTNGKCCAVSFNSNGEDVALISGNTNNLIMINDTTASLNENAPKFNSMAFHHERVFATTRNNRNRVWFSADFNPLNWKVSAEEAGYIEFQDEYGALLEIISLGDYIFVFKENAIMRITAYADQTEFTVTKITVGLDRIISGSIVQLGENIYFLTTSGLYSFDGYTVTRLNRFMPEIIDDRNLTACGLGDKYYYATRLEIDGDEGIGENNAVVVYDLKQKTFSVIGGVDILKLIAVTSHHLRRVYAVRKGDVYVSEITDDGSIYGLSTIKKWKSVESNFGTSAKKVLRRINVFTKRDVKFCVIADGVKTTHEIFGSDKWQSVRIERSGYVMQFEIAGDSVDIKPIELEFDLVK